ncbi:unnamed protein product [Mytilus coruscus]|uniref:Uncharacterized protein n=1 Tax=Mytilus coruscus TaxID=42192 RepID=A0A6J8D5A0_MYTCO|nr:unnamed protein product [Mytilus coruscus]
MKKVKIKKSSVIMDGEIMYLHLIAVNSRKKVPLSRVMSFENAPVPQSMFTDDGKMTACVKSQFVECLDGVCQSEKMTSLYRYNALIYDGHSVVQMLNLPSGTVVPTTFEDMAKRFFDNIFSHSRHCNNNRPVKQIHIVFDRYLEESIKVSQPTDKLVISSPDTDVLVLLIHHRQSIAAENVYFLTGRVVYCLTGCDTTSSFFGHGKKSVFRLLQQRAGSYNGLATLGSSDLTSDQFKHCMSFVGDLYGKKDCFSVDRLRCGKPGKNVPAKKLPPTENSSKLHVLRCIYQLKICRNGNAAMHEQVGPIIQPAAAPKLLKNLIYECDEHNCSENCTSLEHEQVCTAVCSCGASADIADETTCNKPMTIEAMEILSTDNDFDN